MILQTILHKVNIETSAFDAPLFVILRLYVLHFLDHFVELSKNWSMSHRPMFWDVILKKDSSDFSFTRNIDFLTCARDLPDFLFYDAKYWLLDTSVVCYEWILETTNPSMSGFFCQQSPATGTCALYIVSWFIQVPRYFSRTSQDLPRISEGYEGPPRRGLGVYLPFLVQDVDRLFC